MIQVLGRVQIKNLATFVGVFATRGAAMRGQHGGRGARLFRVSESEGEVVVLLSWESREAFEGFLADPEVKETMRASGSMAPARFTFLEEVAEFPS